MQYLFSKLKARWRVFFGFCPLCNSDAPAVDNCPLCASYSRVDNPSPSKQIKEQWITDYYSVLDCKRFTKKAIAKAKRNL